VGRKVNNKIRKKYIEMNGCVKMNGNCLCKKIKINLSKACDRVTACYCGMCRTWADGALFSLEAAYLDNDIEVEGKEWIQEYISSEKAKRGFCKNCGTSLYYKLNSGEYFLNAGLFDDLEFKLVAEYDANQKPAYLQQ